MESGWPHDCAELEANVPLKGNGACWEHSQKWTSASPAWYPRSAVAAPEIYQSLPVHSTERVGRRRTFDKWDATMTFTSPALETAVLDIKIQAASVNTGSGMKDGKLKGKDFFDAEHDPLITFHSTKVVQTGPDTVEFDGDFTIRGVKKPEKLTFTVTGKGTGAGSITGTMAFDRKDYGMNSGIPFIKIADRVEVSVDLKGKRVSGPPVVMH